MDVPNWGLEPVEGKEAGADVPSIAEARVAELAAEAKVLAPENPEKKAADIEAIRAEIAGLANKEETAGLGTPATKLTNEQKLLQAKREFTGELLNNIESNAERDNVVFDLVKERGIDVKKEIVDNIASVLASTVTFRNGGVTKGEVFVTTGGKAISFYRGEAGEKQVLSSDVVKNSSGAFSFTESLEIYGEKVENLWNDYQPEELFVIYADAGKILDMEPKRIDGQEEAAREVATGSTGEIISGFPLHQTEGSAYVNLWENNNDLSKFKAALNFLKENGGGSIGGVDVAVKVKRSSGEVEDDWFISNYNKEKNSFLVVKKNGGGMNKIISNLELVSQNA